MYVLINIYIISGILLTYKSAKENNIFYLVGVDQDGKYTPTISRLIYSYEVPYYQDLVYTFYEKIFGVYGCVFEEQDNFNILNQKELQSEIDRAPKVRKLTLHDIIENRRVKLTGNYFNIDINGYGGRFYKDYPLDPMI